MQPLEYDWEKDVKQLVAVNEFREGNFLKGCKWSPDGLCLLTNSNDNTLRLFNLPQHLYSFPIQPTDSTDMSAVLKMKEADTIYDYCWYPAMHSSYPDTCWLGTMSVVCDCYVGLSLVVVLSVQLKISQFTCLMHSLGQ